MGWREKKGAEARDRVGGREERDVCVHRSSYYIIYTLCTVYR